MQTSIGGKQPTAAHQITLFEEFANEGASVRCDQIGRFLKDFVDIIFH